jgi:hypothetical protein
MAEILLGEAFLSYFDGERRRRNMIYGPLIFSRLISVLTPLQVAYFPGIATKPVLVKRWINFFESEQRKVKVAFFPGIF